MQRLQSLNDLYNVIDSANPPTDATQATGARSSSEAPPAKMSVGDVGEWLSNLVTAESKVKLGPLEIPIGALLGTFARLVQGPRLSGSLHRDGQRLVLLARIEGLPSAPSWRVDSKVLETLTPPTIAQALGTVLDELAYRIFTDIASVGSPIWRAVESYSEGLRTYRQTLGTERHRQAKLLRAEKLFIKARAEDNKFARCYYNLGIVYKDLKRYDSDRAAFELARERDPTLADAAYALAFDYFNRGNYRNALVYTERAINIRPRDPLAGDSRRFHSAARRAAAISSTVGSGSRSLKATKSPRRWHGGSCARLRYHRRCQLPARR
jgi:hypothetical protein